MPRKSIPSETQTSVLIKSRRRCCLCYWLDGVDKNQKGQIAHIDGNNENAAEDNLVFLCFDHHDDLDGTTRLAKGLKQDEVRQWRDELYKEMEHRNRTLTLVPKISVEFAALVSDEPLGDRVELEAEHCEIMSFS